MRNGIALYLRLSKEDMDVHRGRVKNESDSIRSQRVMLQNFVNTIPELKGVCYRICRRWIYRNKF